MREHQQMQFKSVGVAGLALALAIFVTACTAEQVPEEQTSEPVEMQLAVPAFHHMHINAVDPEDSIDWWQTFWPPGEATTIAGYPAFGDAGVYFLYNFKSLQK